MTNQKITKIWAYRLLSRRQLKKHQEVCKEFKIKEPQCYEYWISTHPKTEKRKE